MRKKVDQRIRTLVENGVKLHQRSMFVIVGDRGRDPARRERLPCGRGAERRNSAAFLLRGTRADSRRGVCVARRRS